MGIEERIVIIIGCCFLGYIVQLLVYYWFKIRPITASNFKLMAELPGLEQVEDEQDVKKNLQLLLNDLFSITSSKVIKKYILKKKAKEFFWTWFLLMIVYVLFQLINFQNS